MTHKVLIVLATLLVGTFAVLVFSGKVGLQKDLGNKDVETQASLTPGPAVPLPVNEELINQALASYLPNVLVPSLDGKIFCSHHLYGYDEQKDKNEVAAYVWVYCEEYYQEDSSLKMGSGVSMPVRVLLELQNGVLGVQGHQEPENGEGYASSIKEMFPENYANEAISGYDVSRFSPSPKFQAEEYFK